jgi:hypothetical protein
MAYFHHRLGSARSVGKRRIIKYYATNATDGSVIAARSATAAHIDAQLAKVRLAGAFAARPSDPNKILNRRR